MESGYTPETHQECMNIGISMCSSTTYDGHEMHTCKHEQMIIIIVHNCNYVYQNKLL